MAAASGLNLSRRQLLLRGGASASLFVLGAPFIAACSSGSSTTTATTAATGGGTGTASVGLANAFVTFDPPLSPQLASITVIRHVFEPLMRYDKAADVIIPVLLAGEPESTGNNTYSAQIREGATFHDGSPVTADDVIFTFDYYKDPEVGSFFGTFLQTIESISGSGSELEIKVTKELPGFHFALSIPMIMPKKAFEAAGAEAFGSNPIGSGPYKFVSSTPGQNVQLAKFEDFSGDPKPQLDSIDLTYLLEDASRVAQLTAGQMNIIDGVPYRDMETIASGGDINTGATEGGRYALIEMNQFTGPMADERVRQAMLYALNREELISSVFQGNALVANSQLPPSHPYYIEPEQTYPYDPERAKSLLNAAGHGNGVKFEMLLSTIPWLSELGTLMKSQLEQVGMEADIRLTETEAGYGIVATKKYDTYVAFSNWYAIGQYADIAYRGWNYGIGRDGFYGKVKGRDEKYDKLVDKAFNQTTVEAQKEAYLEAQDLFSKSVFNNYAILWPKVTGAWASSVEGYEPPPDDIPDLVGASA